MTSTKVLAVNNARLQKAFLDLPEQVYRDDTRWAPRIRASEKELVGFADHPFNLRAHSQCFVAMEEDKVVGRIVAINNLLHHDLYPTENTGFIGFFESVNDLKVAKLLFDEACSWLKKKGRSFVRGPVSPSMNYEAGLLINGFEFPPTFMMPYNPNYYVGMWEKKRI